MTQSLSDWTNQRAVTTRLRGITWDHPRGYQGLFAATHTFRALNPQIQIDWDRHSLRHFEAHPIDDLAASYDLIVLDHPFMGAVAASRPLHALDELLSKQELDELANDTVGPSLASYQFAGRLWALPIDAACQSAVYRPDLLAATGLPVPLTMDDVRALSQRGSLALALRNVHSFLLLTAICANLGETMDSLSGVDLKETPFSREVGLEGLELVRELANFCPAEAVDWNSIDCLNAISTRDDLVYCPGVFGFVSYCRPTDAARQLVFGPFPGVRSVDPTGAVLGGTGIAISRRTEAVGAALAFVRFVTSRDVQCEMGLQGGQPARRSSWRDPELNRLHADFYSNTEETIERASVRPRFAGYIPFQTAAGDLVEAYLRERTNPLTVLEQINSAWRGATSGE